jgi:hypothetical protein
MSRIQNANAVKNVGVLVSLKNKWKVVTIEARETNEGPNRCIDFFKSKVKVLNAGSFISLSSKNPKNRIPIL